MTKQEVFDDTIKYYSEDPSRRAVCPDNDGCFYWSATSDKRCAIGRLIPEDLAKEFAKANLPVTCIFSKLPNELQVHGEKFLTDLQFLHDIRRFWDGVGLSEQGKEHVALLRTRHGLK